MPNSAFHFPQVRLAYPATLSTGRSETPPGARLVSAEPVAHRPTPMLCRPKPGAP